MARQLAMDKVLAIKHLEQAGYSERRIAEQLGVSRKAVRNHLGRTGSKDTKAPTGSALTRSESSKDTRALTGSDLESAKAEKPQSASLCAPFHDQILSKLEQGLDATRNLPRPQGRPRLHGEVSLSPPLCRTAWQVNRAAVSTHGSRARPTVASRLWQWARCKNHEGKWIKTYVFRSVLSHSRKGTSEAVTAMTVEKFLMLLENAFWLLVEYRKLSSSTTLRAQ